MGDTPGAVLRRGSRRFRSRDQCRCSRVSGLDQLPLRDDAQRGRAGSRRHPPGDQRGGGQRRLEHAAKTYSSSTPGASDFGNPLRKLPRVWTGRFPASSQRALDRVKGDRRLASRRLCGFRLFVWVVAVARLVDLGVMELELDRWSASRSWGVLPPGADAGHPQLSHPLVCYESAEAETMAIAGASTLLDCAERSAITAHPIL